MDLNEVNMIKNELYELPYSCTLHEISSRYWIDDIDLHKICTAIESDQNFICTLEDENEEKRYIAKRALHGWFIKLSLRLARIKFFALNERQLLSQINNLRLSGTWNHPPSEYIKFGKKLGFLSRLVGQDKYNFAISYIMSFFNQSCMKAARQYLLNTSYNNEDITPQFEHLITERLINVIERLESRQQYVILRRQGLSGFDSMTLEEIGQQIKVSRERIRQIEEKCWRRIWHPRFQSQLVSLLLIYIINRAGSLLVTSIKIQREMKFICKGLNVPLCKFPYIDVTSIGDVNSSITLPEDIWTDLSNLETNVSNFLSSLPLQLIQEDVKQMTNMFIPLILKRLTKTQKVYLALKQIGKPAHFSEVMDIYMDMFPEEHPIEHNIHAILLHEKYGVVWIGTRGMFALEEWGYERPTSSLMDTVASIVEEKYHNTGIPVPFVAIQAEIGKYRKLVNPNSLFIASYLNPRLQSVDDLCFIPQEETQDEINEDKEVSDDKLDRILRGFENKTDGY